MHFPHCLFFMVDYSRLLPDFIGELLINQIPSGKHGWPENPPIRSIYCDDFPYFSSYKPPFLADLPFKNHHVFVPCFVGFVQPATLPGAAVALAASASRRRSTGSVLRRTRNHQARRAQSGRRMWLNVLMWIHGNQ
jgi:hypothetical protein